MMKFSTLSGSKQISEKNNFGTKISANDENHEEINLIKTTGLRERRHCKYVWTYVWTDKTLKLYQLCGILRLTLANIVDRNKTPHSITPYEPFSF